MSTMVERIPKWIIATCIHYAALILSQFGRIARKFLALNQTIQSTPLVFGEGSTHDTDIDECFDYWLQRVCHNLKQNDPTIDEVEIDHRGDLESFDDADMSLLAAALERNKIVHTLKFRNMIIDRKSAEILKTILQSNTNAVTALYLEEIRGGEGIITTSLALALNSVSSIQSLHLIGNCIDVQCSKAIGLMLKSNRSLEELSLRQNTIDEEGLSHISLGLMDNRSLRTLDLEGNALCDASVSKVCRALSHNGTLEFLNLDFNDFGTYGTRAIASMLERNQNIQELHLFGNHIDSMDAIAIASSFRHNSSLKKLNLSFNNISNEGARALAKALTVNKTLTHLSISCNGIGVEGFLSFGKHLPQMRGLEELNVGELYDASSANALLNGLKCNTRLSTLHVQLPICEQYNPEADEIDDISSRYTSCSITSVEDEIDFFLRLNRSGRSILHSQAPTPSSLWALALGKASNNQNSFGAPDVLYHLLRKKPDIVPNKNR